MLNIEDGKITLTKGDTAYLVVNVALDSGVAYTAHEGDTLTFSVKKDLNELTEYSLQKTVAVGEVVNLVPTDTSSLEIGTYFYDVQLDTTLNEVFTIIAPSKFVLKEGVTE